MDGNGDAADELLFEVGLVVRIARDMLGQDLEETERKLAETSVDVERKRMELVRSSCLQAHSLLWTMKTGPFSFSICVPLARGTLGHVLCYGSQLAAAWRRLPRAGPHANPVRTSFDSLALRGFRGRRVWWCMGGHAQQRGVDGSQRRTRRCDEEVKEKQQKAQ